MLTHLLLVVSKSSEPVASMRGARHVDPGGFWLGFCKEARAQVVKTGPVNRPQKEQIG